ncbi:DNA polymerase III subunit alpha [Cytophagaceae bacterium ABcell3]|nr:DNA polymerase III subunit alpha [Cytophagaceae bacterium ABcell3]
MYLNCHTYFSLRYGTLSPEELVAEAIDKGAEVLAITDINNTSATFDFFRLCIKNGIKPIAGIEFRNGGEHLYTGLAVNNKGFAELNAFLSRHNAVGRPLPPIAPEFNDVYIIYPFGSREPEVLRENEFLGIRISELNKLVTMQQGSLRSKLVMLHPVTFRDKKGFNTHRLLRAIDKNTLLSMLPPSEQAPQDEAMLQMDKLMAAYGRFPWIIQNTMKLAESCSILFDGESKNRKNLTGDLNDDRLLLEKLALEGFEQRYGRYNKVAKERLVKELDIINRLGFNAYFLITWDILRYAINRNFAWVGRGSGANSIVAYCLRITDVDPIELDLYFERFLNPYRSSPPDFDIDFSWKERDQVTDYIFKRYGNKHTALLATYNTFKGRSVIRELGKVFGLPKPEIDLIVSHRNPALSAEKDDIVKAIFKYGQNLQDFPNHLSIHAGGVLISEEPIACYTATDLPPKGFPITHFDMFVAEDMGFYKYDILSQRGLGHIRDAVELVRRNTGKAVDLSIENAKKDDKVREHIKAANTIGCFYIESPGMRMLLRKLHCQDYLTMVAASSIIRPGVAQSGMMQQYISRFHKPETIQYLHPKLEELLKETYGVMVYQEDVIKVAHHFAGFDLGEADVLRRAMSGKYRGHSGFKLIQEKFFTKCREKGYDEALTKEVWRQIESFGGYSFSKAHSASFAVESYQSLYLKAHYPLEFCVSVINNFGGFYGTEFYIHEARMAGADIQAPCVNHSDVLTTLHGRQIYIGFGLIKDFERKLGLHISAERDANGAFKSMTDFIKRVPVSPEQLNILIRAGGLRFTGKSKKVLLLESALYFSKQKTRMPAQELFAEEEQALNLPPLSSFSHEDAYDEIELLGFPLCHPFDMLPEEHKQGIAASEMLMHTGKKVTMTGYFVTTKDVYTVHKDIMAFMHFLDINGKTFDTTHFPPSLKRFPLQGRGFYLLRGKIVDEFGHPSMEVEYMEKLPMVRKEVIHLQGFGNLGGV